ncbi:MAG: hypothetical protein AAF687_09240 [Pseudomonadota bacterium]
MSSRFSILSALVAVLCSVAMPAAALAEWHEASSDHFVIYADAGEEDIRAYAENLERFHRLMEYSTGRTVEKPSPSNRVTVYAVGSEGAVRKLAGTSGVAGFYLPRWQGSAAFVQDVRSIKKGRPDLSTTILLHEYVHHFFASTDRFAMPLWMNEGAAEFFSSIAFMEDGSIVTGLSPQHRDFMLFWDEKQQMPVSELLDLDWTRLSVRNSADKNSFYANSWLLYHYLSTVEERSGQLREYWIEVLKGTPSLEAARSAFGGVGPLQRKINLHYRDRDRPVYRAAAELIKAGPVAVRALDAGEAAAMDARIQLDRGVGQDDAAKLAKQMREIAKQHPENAAVLTSLANAEYVAGKDGAAIAAAERALKIDPALTDAYVYKGLSLFRKARQIADPGKKARGYERAMEPLRALGALEADHIVPLLYTYRSYAERNVVPSAEAKSALVRAAGLAPFDQEIWLITGMMHMNDGRIGEARAALLPLASNPHGWEKAEQVKSLLAFLSDKQEGQPIPVQQAISAYFIDE